ncbi:tRNA uracil 4-sulfurtransferase ThiI [Salinicola sp. MIT1003]|uniref:tRNA uracil 4-sulfurtransferase ThiI n=1 Tax=Salinicola sp. MIT1003 TaxID=1882734 RepID=UPI0008DE587B|nr:tRNA uracil 4-sulfurtransferase ThiI [Salinicola sp. MIT1003]OHZ03876.1 tRNA 4-thiouridine(8) synthase ThiI [Salinicola sp. MIT1003]
MRYRVKLFPEITVKSRPVRREMVRYLRTNIRNTLASVAPGVRVRDEWDALEIRPRRSLDDTAREAFEARLRGVAGIHEIQVVETHDWSSFEDTAARLVPLWRETLANRRFRVSVKRRGQHDFRSETLERFLGAALLEAVPSARVDLKQPEHDVRLELHDTRLTLVTRRLPGLGGYPMGTQGQALALISGGYDSPVAAWQMMRRGLKTHFLYFDLGGPDQEHVVRQVVDRLWRGYGASHRVDFISVPFVEVMHAIQRTVPAGLAGVILKRMMVRAANRIAQRHRLPALVTGDALAQVSSQSLTNLGLIDAASERPILRPLIASDKQTIIEQARRIGTAELAEGLPEVCGTISRKPNTRPKPERILDAETGFDQSVLDDAIARASVVRSDQLLNEDVTRSDDAVATASPSATASRDQVRVIDIRHPDERDLDPLVLPEGQPLVIPYFELGERVATLPDDCHYLLYCAQGTMSRMQAAHLTDQGYDNIGVYLPDLPDLPD